MQTYLLVLTKCNVGPRPLKKSELDPTDPNPGALKCILGFETMQITNQLFVYIYKIILARKLKNSKHIINDNNMMGSLP